MEEPSPSALLAPTVLRGGSPWSVVLLERPPAVVGAPSEDLEVPSHIPSHV